MGDESDKEECGIGHPTDNLWEDRDAGLSRGSSSIDLADVQNNKVTNEAQNITLQEERVAINLVLFF